MTSFIPWRRNGSQGNTALQVAPVSKMRLDWDRMFDHFLDDGWPPSASASHGLLLDLSETDEGIRVRAEVPGMSPEDLDICLAGDVLTLSAQKVDEDESRAGNLHYSERHFGAYRRAVKLPCPVDPEGVTAEHKNGVVTIMLQKADAVRPKRIAVKSA